MPMDQAGAEVTALRSRIVNGNECIMDALLLAEQRVNYAAEYGAYVLPAHFATRTGVDFAGAMNQLLEGLSELKAMCVTIDEQLGSYLAGLA